MSESHKYKSELVKTAYKYLQISSIAVVLNATVLSVVLYEHVDTTYLLIWYISMLIVSSLRFASSKYYNKHKERFSTKRWEQLFLLGVVVAGLLWSTSSFILFVKDSLLHQMMLIIVLAGVSAGAISTLSSLIKAIRIFLVLVTVPLILALLTQNSSIYMYVAILEIMYLIMLLNISKQFYNQYLFIIKSKIKNSIQEEKILLSEERFKKIFKEAPVGILLYDTNLKIKEVNQELSDILEAPKEFLIGLDLTTLSDSRVIPSFKSALNNDKGEYEGEYKTKYKNKTIWINIHATPLLNTKNEVYGAIATITDITQRMKNQWLIEYQAKYDTLTDIPNRSSLMEHIKHNIDLYNHHKIIFSLFFLDIDNFKNINDTLGHNIGDSILVQITKRLKGILREEDIIARIGGDEFVIVLPNLTTDRHEASKKIDIISKKIHTSLLKTFKIDQHHLNVSTSIGIVTMNNNEDTADDLLKHADVAMYQAKKDGRSVSRYYFDEMKEGLQRRINIENGLRDAIAKKELDVVYQPVISTKTGEIIGAEALLRWNSKKLGSITPDEFIIIAEESGSILEIGEWVLNRAVEQFAKWKRDFAHIKSFEKIAINVSSKQFNHPDFVMQINQVIKKSGINPNHLELELTESIILNDISVVSNEMQSLRDLGINISMDDFGTGYSSLSYLKKLPFSTLKIDKTFTQDISHESNNKDLISTIITISENFNLEIIAEGVETLNQYKFLKEKGCNYIQGYYCSKPMNAKLFTEYLSSNNPKYKAHPKDPNNMFMVFEGAI
jgi:diguanylate cyclase (GGDEF)-like protein/PAS domain S-box-containing protein